MSIDVPAGALPDEVTITVDALGEIAPPKGTVTFGNAYLLGPEGTTFTGPVKVTLPWRGIVPQGKRVILARQPAAGGEWVLVTDGAGANETQVWAETTSFSLWVPVIACEAGMIQCVDGFCRQDCSGSCTPPNTICSVTTTLDTCTNLQTDPKTAALVDERVKSPSSASPASVSDTDDPNEEAEFSTRPRSAGGPSTAHAGGASGPPAHRRRHGRPRVCARTRAHCRARECGRSRA